MTNTPDDLTDAPAQIRHMASLSRRSHVDTTITRTERGYRVLIASTVRDRRIEMTVVRRGNRWVGEDPSFTENGVELDIAGGLAEMLRAMSQAGDMVGSPAASTRYQGSNPTLVTRSHTIIRN
jgi:hypothetical protein